ncbi:FAD-dependent monooxygenase [Pseudonocardia nematodicida]|uniref:FAD-dependent monooxygenase n=1 Tax=Pseudonocardia nematodicida TaxID=1206997 RepID=A0ABV1K6J9_9PSEU
MQFYLDGYEPGDPLIEKPVRDHPSELPATADVVIIGSGPAGLVLAAQLAAFPELHTVVVERREGPLAVGQADGVACRTVEMFEAFGLADRLIGEGYQVNEVTFWRPDPEDPASIVRTGRVDDVEEGISEMPHMIVNQARMLAYLREHMARSATRAEPYYGLHVTDVRVEAGEYPVVVELDGRTIRAKYVVGCDGSRSVTREAMGLRLRGDATHQSWGVLDVLAVTDFPDIRLKSAIASEQGSILVIPREGGYLVRLYIELEPGVSRGDVTPEHLAAVANRILHPYEIDVRSVGWWAVYEIAQRVCDRFDDGDDPRVFIAGDACHTHSAKAGQGMNVSMADAWNLGWKLGTVLRGTARPEILRTYSTERQAVARRLIEFDKEFAALFSDRDAEPEKFQHYFREQGRYTAGVAVRYGPSLLTGEPTYQELAEGFPVGMRFQSAPVVRLADAKPMHLGHAARADGAWRLYVFADRSRAGLESLCATLPDLLARFTPDGAEPDSVIDVRAILQQGHRDLSVPDVPSVLLPRKGRFGLTDYEKVFCPEPGQDVFDLRGVDRTRGAVVVVRPDQYVAQVLPLDGDVAGFLADVLVPLR